MSESIPKEIMRLTQIRIMISLMRYSADHNAMMINPVTQNFAYEEIPDMFVSYW